ncbi:MAG: hypothetical protein ABSC95_20995 [Acetobacteraceae bacterium]|jgi:hypothetical protein
MAESDLPRARYESADISARALTAGLAGVLLALLCSMFLAMWLYPAITKDHRLGASLPQYPAPRLQVDSAKELQQFLAVETKQLNSAGWIDQAHAVAHIPIGEAMRIIAQQGIPDWPATKGTQP